MKNFMRVMAFVLIYWQSSLVGAGVIEVDFAALDETFVSDPISVESLSDSEVVDEISLESIENLFTSLFQNTFKSLSSFDRVFSRVQSSLYMPKFSIISTVYDSIVLISDSNIFDVDYSLVGVGKPLDRLYFF